MDSASKRSVIRSPLELLANEKTPPPPQRNNNSTVQQQVLSQPVVSSTPQQQKLRQEDDQRQQIPQRVVNVTRTTTNARETIVFAAGGHEHQNNNIAEPSSQPRSIEKARTSPSHTVSAHVQLQEEPSALMFMSPLQPLQGRTTAEGKLPRSSRRSGSSSSSHRNKRRNGSSSHDESSANVDDDMMSRAEAEAFVRRTLEDYEKRRDEEEERVLDDIQKEMDHLNETRQLAEERASKALEQLRVEQASVAKLEAQCMMLATTTQEMHEELLTEKERAKELDIAECHANDRRRTQVADVRRELEFERGQWAMAKSEFEQRLSDLHENHQREVEDVRFRAHEAGSAVTELQAQLKGALAKLDTERECREQLEHKLKTAEAALERAVQEARESGDSRQSLEKKSTVLERREQAHANELRAHQQHTTQLEESLRSLNDDVRKKMHRIQVLESEVTRAQQESAGAWRERDAMMERVVLVHASVEALWGTLKSGVRQQVSSVLDQLRHPSGGGGLQIPAVADSIRDELESSSMLEDDLLRRLNAELGPFGGDVLDADHAAVLEDVPAGRPPAATYRGRAFSMQQRATAAGFRRGRHPSPPAASFRGAGAPQTVPTRSSSAPSRGKALTSPPDTLRVLNMIHEKAHVLLRQLHLRQADTTASLREMRETASQQAKDLARVQEERDAVIKERDTLAKGSGALSQKLRSVEDALAERSADLVALNEELRCARTQSQHWEQRWKSVDFESTEVRTKAAGIQQQLDSVSRQLEARDGALRQVEDASRERLAQLDHVQRELASKTKALESADEMLLKSSREVGDVLQQKEKSQKVITKLHSELAHCRAELMRTHEEVSLLQTRTAKLEGQLNLARKSTARAGKQQEHQNDALHQELIAVKVQLKQSTEHAATTEHELHETAKKLHQYRTRLATFLQGRDHESLQCGGALNEVLHRLRGLSEGICGELSPHGMLQVLPTASPSSPPLREVPRSRSNSAVGVGHAHKASPPINTSVAERHRLDPFAPQEATPTRLAQMDLLPALSSVALPDDASVIGSSSSTTLLGLCAALEAVSLELARAWSLCCNQKHQQVRALEQTVAFLELELQCQSSQMRQQQHQKPSQHAHRNTGSSGGQQRQPRSPLTPPSHTTPSAFAFVDDDCTSDGGRVPSSSPPPTTTAPPVATSLTFVSPTPVRAVAMGQSSSHGQQHAQDARHKHPQHLNTSKDAFTEVAPQPMLAARASPAAAVMTMFEPPSTLSVLDDAHGIRKHPPSEYYSSQAPHVNTSAVAAAVAGRRSTSRSPSPQAFQQGHQSELQVHRNGVTGVRGEVLLTASMGPTYVSSAPAPHHLLGASLDHHKAATLDRGSQSLASRSHSRSIDGLSESPMRPPSLRMPR